MMNFDNLTMKAFLQENSEFFIGARVQKIQQPTRRDFIFSLRNCGCSKKFYVNINPSIYHLCFMSQENEAKRNLEIPKAPPMFCMLLRKYLEGARISKVEQPEYERILELYFETYNEIGEKIELCLAFELMGKHSNVVLYNFDTNVIIGCAHNVGAEKSREREMAGGLPYTYPTRTPKQDILNYPFEVNTEKLSSDFYGFSTPFADMCKTQSVQKLKSYQLLQNISPGISKDYEKFCLFSELLNEPIIKSSVSEMIDDYFAFHQENQSIQQIANKLSAITEKKLKKNKEAYEKINLQANKYKNGPKYKLKADLLLSNLHSLKDYTKTAKVFDYTTQSDIIIELDETKSIKENAQRYYKLYNKSKIASQKAETMSEKLQTEIQYLEDTAYFIKKADSIDDLMEISLEINQEAPKKKELKLVVNKTEIMGHTVYFGKNNKQNDYIVSKLLNDEDYWFHCKNGPGSHVLLQIKNRTTPSDELIFECAKLAKNNCSAKDSSKVAIVYTMGKYVKKPPGQRLGYVIYKQAQEILID